MPVHRPGPKLLSPLVSCNVVQVSEAVQEFALIQRGNPSRYRSIGIFILLLDEGKGHPRRHIDSR
jgi:hypothetical protein